MIANHVGALYPDRFNGIALGKVQGASVGATGNAVATIPITSGTAYIVRQITVANANATIATANVATLKWSAYTVTDNNANNLYVYNGTVSAAGTAVRCALCAVGCAHPGRTFWRASHRL